MQYFRYRLYPSKAQAARLDTALELRRGPSLRQIAGVRLADACYAAVHSRSYQLVATAVDRAWRTWQQRRNQGRPPRPRRAGKVLSLGFKQDCNGFQIDGRRLRLSTIGRVAIRWHSPLQGVVKSLRVFRKAGRWYATFGCVVEPAPLPATGLDIGISLGTESLLTLSSGDRIPHPRWALAAQDRLRRLRERLHATAPGSRAYRRAKLRLGCAHVCVAARWKDYLAKVVAWLLSRYDRIAIENLDVGRLASMRMSIADAGWGLFRRLLIAKAKATGRLVALVNPACTSKNCSACGSRIRRALPLSVRQFACDQCEYRADRDVNAARVVLRRAQELWEPDACRGPVAPANSPDCSPDP
jgi:putative transposase